MMGVTPMRIVSLVPSATEIVASLGLLDALVGISADCDFPPGIRGKPVLSEALVEADLSSPAIDRRIRDHVHAGSSVYHLDSEQLARLRPDLILTQEVCAVCAPSYALVRQAAKMRDTETRIVSLEPRGLADILDNIRLVGDLTGAGPRSSAVVSALQARIDGVVPGAGLDRPRVVCIEWLNPLFVGGRWVPEMVSAAGGTDALGSAGEASRAVDWEQVRGATPDVIVLMPCGFDVARTRAEIGLLVDLPGWDDLPAVRRGRVFLTNASAYFNRPGPRIVDGLEILAAALHPEASVRMPPPGSLERL
jgi:iron complex transport system substrate-binding protein